jgi:hypothetical protein
MTKQGIEVPQRPEHIGAEWVIEASDSAYVHHALSMIESDEDDEGDGVLGLMEKAGAIQVKF